MVKSQHLLGSSKRTLGIQVRKSYIRYMYSRRFYLHISKSAAEANSVHTEGGTQTTREEMGPTSSPSVRTGLLSCV